MARSNFLKALALLSLTLCVASAEFEFIFKTTVDGESNIPVLTDAQTGGAKAYFDVIWEGDYFTWYMEVEGIQNMTMAHIHMVRRGGRQLRQGLGRTPMLPPLRAAVSASPPYAQTLTHSISLQSTG